MFLLSVGAIWEVAAITPGPDLHRRQNGAGGVAKCRGSRLRRLSLCRHASGRVQLDAGCGGRRRKALDAAAGVIFMGFGLKLLTSAW